MENAKFEEKMRSTDEILKRTGNRPPHRDKYSIINTQLLDNMTLPKHKDFAKLKLELDEFNDQVRKALAENKSIYSYAWKHSLFSGLKSMLVDIASTEEKILMERFLAIAKKWFNNKMEKKRQAGELEKSVSIAYTQSTRAVSDNSRAMSASRAKRDNEHDKSLNLNISAILPEGDKSIDEKSFFAEGISEIMPSRYRADMLKDYEECSRTINNSVDPPYERIVHYERKVPKGILKPISTKKKAKKDDHTIEISKPVNILKDEELEENLSGSEKGSEAGGDEKDGDGDDEKEEKEEQEAPEPPEGAEEAEGQENKATEEDVKIEPKVFKPGIVNPVHKAYVNSKLTRKMLGPKDLHIPMETRSAYSHYNSSGATQELNLERRWRESMNKKVIERREATEFRAYMKQWSQAKARLEEETIRKHDSFNLGSCFGKRAFNGRPQSVLPDSPGKENNEVSFSTIGDKTRLNQSALDQSTEKIVVYQEAKDKKVEPKIVDLGELRKRNSSLNRTDLNKTIEGDMSRLRISNIQKFHESTLFHSRGVASDIGEDGAYSYNRPLSLSVFDNQSRKNYTPFSMVHEKVNGSAYLDKQISVVSEIKAKLAKFRTKVSLKSLDNTILPTKNTTSDNTITNNTTVLLPEPGKGLFFNPFIKVSKGRKKKGKKK